MLNKGNNFIFMRMVGAVVLCLVALPLSARPQSTQGAPSTEQILEYTRELLAFPETTMLTAGPIHASQFPGYYEATITAGAGVHAKTWNVALSTNRDFLIVGKLFDAGSDFQSIAATDLLRDAVGTLALDQDQQPAGAADAGDPTTNAGGGRLPGWQVGTDAGGRSPQIRGRHSMGHQTLSADEPPG